MNNSEKENLIENDNSNSYQGLVATDFDGTLADHDSSITSGNLETLNMLGRLGYARAIITGRSLVSFLKTAGHDVPIDFLGFSSGIGIYNYQNRTMMKHYCFNAPQARRIGKQLFSLDCDFMVHLPVPENHRFLYRDMKRGNKDFYVRRQHYRDFAAPLADLASLPAKISQFLVIEPADSGLFMELEKNLRECTIIRTTSPFDACSMWIEIFPADVHKGSTLNWLVSKLGLTMKQVLAIGNDYNDLHMLKYAGTGIVVENAPESLRTRFAVVQANHKEGFTQAVEEWLGHQDAT